MKTTPERLIIVGLSSKNLYYKKKQCFVLKGKDKFRLDGVGPVDSRPSTNKLHHFVQKKNIYIWHVTCDMWHVTRDTVWYYEDLEEKPDSLIQLMNDEAVYRTAPATPGLLNTNQTNYSHK